MPPPIFAFRFRLGACILTVMGKCDEIGEKGTGLYWHTVYPLPDGRVLVNWFPGSAPAGDSQDAEHSQRDASEAEAPSEQQRLQQRKRRNPR